jgi:hypothetical protein
VIQYYWILQRQTIAALQMPNPPSELPYHSSSVVLTGVGIVRYEDGGVTVTIGAPPPPSPLMIAFDASIACVACTMALWFAGAPPWRLPALLISLLNGAYRTPWWAVLVIVAPLMIWAWSILHRLRRRGRPAVVGISRRSIYVDAPGWFFDRRFEVTRRTLKRVAVVYWERTFRKRPRLVNLCFVDRRPVSFAVGRSDLEIVQIARALIEAEKATGPSKGAA